MQWVSPYGVQVCKTRLRWKLDPESDSVRRRHPNDLPIMDLRIYPLYGLRIYPLPLSTPTPTLRPPL